jgi:hypothetical protein
VFYAAAIVLLEILVGADRLCAPEGAERARCIFRVNALMLPSRPAHFLLTTLTMPWSHSAVSHILFVTLLTWTALQTHEIRQGTRSTVRVFFGANTVSMTAGALILLAGARIAPAGTALQRWFKQQCHYSYSGGSCANFCTLFSLVGRHGNYLKYIWYYVLFETVNLQVYHMRAGVVMGHVICATVGLVWGVVEKRMLPSSEKKQETLSIRDTKPGSHIAYHVV